MSGDGKRGDGHRPPATAPIFDSTRSDEVITIERVGSLVFSGPACNGANGRGWL